jgi:hypothetical protein
MVASLDSLALIFRRCHISLPNHRYREIVYPDNTHTHPEPDDIDGKLTAIGDRARFDALLNIHIVHRCAAAFSGFSTRAAIVKKRSKLVSQKPNFALCKAVKY